MNRLEANRGDKIWTPPGPYHDSGRPAMPDDDAFLRAILDHPDDDLPRLVYADWLDEHGDPGRAEVIRVQGERARLPEDDPRRADLEDREAALLLAHEERWRQELPEGARRERDSKPARMFR